MQSRSVDSPIQNKALGTGAVSADGSTLRHVSNSNTDTFVSRPGVSRPATPSPLQQPTGAGGTRVFDKSAQGYIERAEHEFAVGHVRQALDSVTRAITADSLATDACLALLWNKPVAGQMPGILRHVLSRFAPGSRAYEIYQWMLVLAYHAKGARQLGLRLLGQALGGIQGSTVEQWLRQRGMGEVLQAEFWNGVPANATVGDGLTRARRTLIVALNLTDAHVQDTVPLVGAFLGTQRDILQCLGAAQTLRLLELHARREPGLMLKDNDVRAMVNTLTEPQRRAHLAVAVAQGHAFHVSALLASGVALSDLSPATFNFRTCDDPKLVTQLLAAGVRVDALANLMMQRPAAEGGQAARLPVDSLDVLLKGGLPPDYRIDGKADGPTLLWEAVRRKDAACVQLLRAAQAGCNAMMLVRHADGSEGFITPGLAAIAQGDALTLRAMNMTDAAALLPGIKVILEAVKRI